MKIIKKYSQHILISILIVCIGLYIQKYRASNKIQSKLSSIEYDLDEANEKIQELQSKISEIRFHAVYLESEIGSLIREVRWAEYDCSSCIWGVERKAKSVQSNFEDLENAIDN